MKHLTTHGTVLRDAENRHVILSGINLINKGGQNREYQSAWDADLFAQFRAWGFNVLRFGVIWDAIEPQPGAYDESYLQWIGGVLDLAAAHDLSVFLDMHQDLFSQLYSDGAPAWATLGKDAPHANEELWSNAYLSSDAVKQSFDAFWADKPAEDGVGIRTRFAAMWGMLAERFGDHPALIGYDLFNEPFPGSASDLVFGALIGGIGEALGAATGDDAAVDADQAIAAFLDPESREQVLGLLNDHAVYQQITDAAAQPVVAFDAGPYAGFTRTMTQSIRAVDSRSLIFIGNTYFSNMGVPSGIELVAGEDDSPLPQQVFAPHGYDLVVDTEAVQRASDTRMDFILNRHLATQQRLSCPVMFGEWGAHSNYPLGLGHIRHILDRFEDALWSNTYWCYEDDITGFPVMDVLARAYPQATVGTLLHYRSTADSLEMTWDEGESATGESLLRVPWPIGEAMIDGSPASDIAHEHSLVRIPAAGGQRSLRIARRARQ